jgi:hypothetical protein
MNIRTASLALESLTTLRINYMNEILEGAPSGKNAGTMVLYSAMTSDRADRDRPMVLQRLQCTTVCW